MIQAVMLIALGFMSAGLIGVLIAPALWHRAARLSRKRLEQTLPVTLSEIEAAQDRLRASYAVRIRRLETALAGAKQRAASQLVENSRLQMQIAALKDQISDLDLKLSERQNAATVLEQTISRRFPELDHEVTEARAQLEARFEDIRDLSNKLNRRNEELEDAQRAAAAYQEEVERLRQAFEKNSADRGGRRLRGASKWSLDDYRAEYDRLNLEMSRLRQQLAQLQEREAGQAGIIKGELHKLTELMLASAQPKSGPSPEKLPSAKRFRSSEPRRGRPVPWSEGGSKPAAFSAAPPVAAFSAPPEKTTTAADGGGSADAAGGSRAGRSKLLAGALPEKAEKQTGAAPARENARAPANPVMSAPDAAGAAPKTGGADGGADGAPAKDAGGKDEKPGVHGITLLEKLREADGDAV